jgi:adenine-specific DNA-methyltransferase
LAYQQGFKLVSDIGKERIRRVIRKMKEAAAGGQLSLPAAEDASTTPLDLGFKVFKLACSHFKPWTPLPPADAQTLDGLLDQHASPLVEGWTKDGLLSEILLIEGFPLDSRVTPLEAFTENVVWRVHHADVAHELFVCLDEKIQPATIERLKSGAVLGREDLFICLDSALSDEAKVVLDDRLRLKVI